MASRILPIERPQSPVQRRPRMVDERHLRFVRTLPCAICGVRRSEAAHLRIGNRLVGKRETGAGEKPSDRWVTPLCREHHTEQHTMGEIVFWRGHGIDNPFQLALALFAASVADDADLAEAILTEHRLRAMVG